MFDWFNDPSAWAALFTLTLLEIVLGIDNIVFISILVGRLPGAQRQRARITGLLVPPLSHPPAIQSYALACLAIPPLAFVTGRLLQKLAPAT